MYNYVAGTDDKNTGRRRGKDSQQIPETFKKYIEDAMVKGYVSVPQMVNGKEVNVRFGVCKETIAEFVDEEECNAEMIERTIARLEADGKKWKYDKPQDWKKLGYEDPMDDKWSFVVNSKTKFADDDEPSEEKPSTRRSYRND